MIVHNLRSVYSRIKVNHMKKKKRKKLKIYFFRNTIPVAKQVSPPLDASSKSMTPVIRSAPFLFSFPTF